MNLNTIHHLNFLHNTLPDACAKLIIADPPYHEVKGSFDFIWPSFASYLADVERWAAECKRILAPNGTLLWWGHPLKIAHSQVILDKYFNLLNSAVWEKQDGQCRRNRPSDQRAFIPVTERCAVYENFNQSENDWRNNNAAVYWEGWEPVRLELGAMVERAGLRAVAAACGVSARAVQHWTSRSQWAFPSAEKWEILKRMSGVSDDSLRAEFDRLRAEFASVARRPFSLPVVRGIGMTDVWLYPAESHKTKEFDHDTQKPERLTSMLVEACSRPGDLVVVPFSGSGTECAMSAKAGRPFVGFEIDAGHVATGTARCAPYLATATDGSKVLAVGRLF